jgi:hypothetical protein
MSIDFLNSGEIEKKTSMPRFALELLGFGGILPDFSIEISVFDNESHISFDMSTFMTVFR